MGAAGAGRGRRRRRRLLLGRRGRLELELEVVEEAARLAAGAREQRPRSSEAERLKALSGTDRDTAATPAQHILRLRARMGYLLEPGEGVYPDLAFFSVFEALKKLLLAHALQANPPLAQIGQAGTGVRGRLTKAHV